MNIIKLLWLKSIFMFLVSFVLLGCGNSNSTAKHTQSSVTVKVSFSNMEVNNKLSKQLQKTTAEISRITLDVNSSTHFYVQGKPFTHNNDQWVISLPALPTSKSLTFIAKGYNVEGTLLYKGSHTTTLSSTGNNNVDISLTPIAEIEQQVPTLSSLVFQNIDKTELLFTIRNPNRDTIHYQITANQEDDGSFSPDYGDISFEQGEAAQLQVHYNKPTTAGTYHYLFTMTDSNGNSFIATFDIEVVEKTENAQVYLNLPPSIDSIEAQSSSNSLTLTANVHDDSEDTLSYVWSLIEGSVSINGSSTQSVITLSNYGVNSAFKIKLTVADAHGASSTMVYSFNGNHITRVRDYQLLFFAQNSDTEKDKLWKIDSSGHPILLKAFDSSSNNIIYFYNTIIDGIIYFRAKDDIHGYELWRSDGTVNGTYMVKDINPNGSAYPRFFTNINGILYFRADDGIHGNELWRSDGTEDGTYMVKDINPNGYSSPDNLINLNGILYFRADDDTHGEELWRSDGTEDGTYMVKDINPNGDSSPVYLTNVNGILYFSTKGKLWRSDGTEDGTYMVKDINPNGYTFLENLINVNGVLYFNASDGTHGRELWRSDGTANGTYMVKDINPNGDSILSYLTNVNGVLYFVTGENSRELWRSDGTSNGTYIVVDNMSLSPSLVNFNGVLYFTKDNELWRSDGTANGTYMVKDVDCAFIASIINVNGVLYFSTDDPINYRELWKSDGTEAGTVKVFPTEP